MKQDNMISLRAVLERMSTEQLSELLQSEIHNEDSNGELFRLILEVLGDREDNAPTEVTPAMEAALLDYEAAMKNVRRPSVLPFVSKRLRSCVAAVLVALVAFFFLIPQEVKAGNLWDKLARWTEGIVEFFSPDDNKDRLVSYEFKTDNPGLQQVYDAVVELGITDPVVPMWLPDGYSLVECDTVAQPAKTYVHSRFVYDDLEFIFKVNIYEVEKSHSYDKDESEIVKIEIDSTTYNIMRNNDVWVVIWTKDNIECSILTDCQEDTLHRILGSIYVMEGN